MSLLIKLTLAGFVLAGGGAEVFAKDWKGIVPLRSTRSDVIRLMNQCGEYREACQFETENERVYILFSGGLEPHYQRNCTLRVAPETVMFIEVVPTHKLKLKDLGLEKKTLRPFGIIESYSSKRKGYYNQTGLIIGAYGEEIESLAYVAESPENPLSVCSDFYRDPVPFIQRFSVHPPPTGYLQCPAARSGDELTLRASATVDLMRGPTWSLIGGKIISGQFTRTIVVDTRGLAGSKVIATAEFSDIGLHTFSVSCEVKILPDEQ